MPSYLLKVTKFLGKIPLFEFLVMTGKNIFAYKLSLSLNISEFTFHVEIETTPWKKSPLSFPATPSKSWDPVKSLLFENLVGGSTPPAEKGVHTMRFDEAC